MRKISEVMRRMIEQVKQSSYVYINMLDMNSDFESNLYDCLETGLLPPIERDPEKVSFSGGYASTLDPEALFATTARKGKAISMWRNPGYTPFGIIINPKYIDDLRQYDLIKPDGISWSFEGIRIYRRIPPHELIGCVMEMEPKEAAQQTNALIDDDNRIMMAQFGVFPIESFKEKTMAEIMNRIHNTAPELELPVFNCDWNLVYPK